MGKKPLYLQTRIKDPISFKENPPRSSSGDIKRNKFGLDDNAVGISATT